MKIVLVLRRGATVSGFQVGARQHWYMNFEELTVRGNEFGVHSINHEVDKGHMRQLRVLNFNDESRDYMIYLSKSDHSWWKNLVIRGHEITYDLQDK